jgi:hypothetical protein
MLIDHIIEPRDILSTRLDTRIWNAAYTLYYVCAVGIRTAICLQRDFVSCSCFCYYDWDVSFETFYVLGLASLWALTVPVLWVRFYSDARS